MNKNILVVGDWFVDEYWFVIRHYSDVSSHTGPSHYRIVSDVNEAVKDLCGAGLVARILYELRKYKIDDIIEIINRVNSAIDDSFKDKKKIEEIKKIIEEKNEKEINLKNDCLINLKKIIKDNSLEIIIDIENPEYNNKQFNLFGLGCWNKDDTEIIKHFIHAHCQPYGMALQANSSLFPKTCSEKSFDINLETLVQDFATTRCIRTYSYVGSSIKQLHRIDWEQRPNKITKKIYDKFWWEPLDAVIIEDHKKGVIDNDLINEIKTREANGCRWFVRTKNNRIQKNDKEEWPDWLRAIKTVELLVVGSEIACRSYPISGLLTDKGHLAEHAYTLIDTIIGGKTKVKNVALISDKFEVVVLLDDFCFIAKAPSEIKNIELTKINWTTAFFAALVYEILTADGNNNYNENYKMIEQAINDAYSHSGIDLPKVLQIPVGQASIPKAKINETREWSIIHNEWDMAKKDKGIIELDGNKRLDIWRASTDLPGYIACIKEKREAIRRIWQKLDIFTQRKEVDQSLCILLEADPASGKSHLAKTLAQNIQNCNYVSHDITQMIERSELLDLFDMVANAQAQSSGPVFVFVDEINATLGSSPIYGAFLSPLEAGNYMRDGQRIKLKPCIWMFAGTPQNSGLYEKREDFESRMTLIERIDYNSIKKNPSGRRNDADIDHEARLEQVYLGAQFINNAFNDVIKIDVDILKVFAELSPDEAPARRIKRLASSLENVQYGRVHKGNCTSLEWQIIIQDKIPSQARERWMRESQALDDDNVTWVELGLN